MPSSNNVKKLYSKFRKVKERNKKIQSEKDDIMNLLKESGNKNNIKNNFALSNNEQNSNDIMEEMKEDNKISNHKHSKSNHIHNIQNRNKHTLADKQSQIAVNIQKLIDLLEIPESDSISETPSRVGNMLVNELFIGLDETKFPQYTMFDIDDDYKSPIVVENIGIYSICEHHFLPFIGTATFKYIPKKQVIGLSKIPRIIDFLARKPQLQEKLTMEIFETFRDILDTDNISIELKCEHCCVKMRGVKDDAVMITSKKGGVFK